MKKIFIGILLASVFIISLCVNATDSNTLHYDDGEISFNYPATMTAVSTSNMLFLEDIARNPEFKDKYAAEL